MSLQMGLQDQTRTPDDDFWALHGHHGNTSTVFSPYEVFIVVPCFATAACTSLAVITSCQERFNINSPKHWHEGAARAVALVVQVIKSSFILLTRVSQERCPCLVAQTDKRFFTLFQAVRDESFVCEGSCQHHPHYSPPPTHNNPPSTRNQKPECSGDDSNQLRW